MNIVFFDALTHYLFDKPFDESYSQIHHNLVFLKADILRKSLCLYIIFTALLLLQISIFGIFYSHKIAGPLVRVRHMAKQIADGDFNAKTRFRKDDAINPLADALNEMAASYNERYNRLGSCTDAMLEAVVELEKYTRENNPEMARRVIATITVKSDEINRILSDIKI